MQEALARHDAILRTAIEVHDGHVVKMTGDGAHAAFVTADAAAGAAVDAQLALAAEAWGETGELRVRMGLHTGPAEQRDGDYFGTAVNRAARIMSAAHGGQIVVSLACEELLRDAMPDEYTLVDLGEHRLRDLSRAERAFQLEGPGLATTFPHLQSLDAFPGNLPVQLTSFVGRDDDVAGLAKALAESRLVTLTGVGGVGKTRLALQVAAEVLPRFADGVWLCELAATNDADLLAQVVVAALAVQSRPGRSLAESVCDYLSGKQALIVLDNCEHLLDEAAALAEAMLRAALGVRVLATSREPLGVAGERLLGVPSLDVASASESNLEAIAACEAVQLFMDRAAATRSGLELDGTNAEQIVEICRRLDAIPLAIELAAARVTSMSPGEIAGLLDERFRLLTGGRRRGVERHQTLRATVEWSYSLLDERERIVFDRVGVFAGSFDADAATAVAGDDELEAWDVRDGLDDLAAKSMIQLDDGPDATTRFRLLETLRQYALERLDDTGQTEEHRRRHAEHYAGFAEAAGPGLEGPDEAAWFLRFDAELDDLRAAVAWALDAPTQADAELGLRIVAPLVGQSFYRPSAGLGEWAEAALARAETSTPGRRCAVLAAAAWKAVLEGDLDLARTRASEALRDGLPPDTPSPAWAHSAARDCRLLCRGPSGRVANARGRPASSRRHRCPRLRPPRARPQRPHGSLCGRSTRGGPHAGRGGPPAGPYARQPEPAHRCAPVVRRDASTRRVGRNDRGARRMPGPQPRRRHPRRTRCAATSRVARTAPCSSPRTRASHRGATRRGRPRPRHRTVSHVGLRAQLRRERCRQSRCSGARDDGWRCRHRQRSCCSHSAARSSNCK